MKRILALVLACATIAATSACSAKKGPTSAAASEDTSNVTLTYWVQLNAVTAQVVKNLGDTEFSKELTQATGVKVKYTHPASSNSSEAFNVLVASGDYPDIIEYNWGTYSGGPSAAIKNKVILPLNDTFKKYSPNISKILKDSAEVDRMIQTADGQYYVYPFLRGTTAKNNEMLYSDGFVIRKDLLDKVHMSAPSTPDEWYQVLSAFKNQLHIKTPMTIKAGSDATMLSRELAGGFDSWGDFYIDGGKIKNGLVESTRLDYLTAMRKWYAEGLLDNDYLVVDTKAQNSKMLNSTSAVTYAPGGSGLGTWNTQMKAADSSAELISTVPITSKKGRNARFSKMNQLYDGSGAAITTSCKHVAAAAKLLDYLYGDKGHMLANFGIEGKSYTMKNNVPTYTGEILQNSKYAVSAAQSIYMRGHLSGPLMQDTRELEQVYSQPEQQEALKLWTKTEMPSHILPVLDISSTDSDTVAKITQNIKDYSSEMEAKFISGAQPLNAQTFAEYVKQIQSFGLDKAISIYQKAYDSYMKKK